MNRTGDGFLPTRVGKKPETAGFCRWLSARKDAHLVNRPKLTLYQPATYQISVPGELGENWSDWVAGMTITVDREGEGDRNSRPVTTLTGILDQAALHGLLRRLYALGLPLISVVWIECGSNDSTEVVDRCR